MDSLDASVLFVWLLCLVIGILIGWQKDQFVSGIVWSFFFGPLGVIVVACLPNKKRQAEEASSKTLFLQQMEIQRQQLEEMRKLRNPSQDTPILPSKLRIAKDGQEIGEMGIGVIKTMLRNRQLAATDHYLDPESNEWMTLDSLA